MDAGNFSWVKNYDSGVPWQYDFPLEPVYKMLDRTVQAYGSCSAMDFLGKKTNWQTIGKAVDALACALQQKYPEGGAAIGLLLPNTPYYLIAYFAILKAGCRVVNLNPLYARQELEFLIEDAAIDMVITVDLAIIFDKLEPLLAATCLNTIVVASFAEALPFHKRILFQLLKRKERADVSWDARILRWHDFMRSGQAWQWVEPLIDPAKDVALLQYTGGTTGRPKGAMLTHRNVLSNVLQCNLWFSDVEPGQVKMLGALPFFHVFAMTTVMNFAVLAAMEIIAMPRFDLKAALKIIHRKKPHLFPAVPAIYSAINSASHIDRYDMTSLIYCISGGAPLPAEVKRAFEERTGCALVEGYGLSEASPVVCANPLKGQSKDASIGLPFPGTVVEIVNPEDKKTVMPIGELGELCVRGPQVMKGYWNNQEASDEVLIDGRLHTGDIAYLDEDGYVFIVDRLKDMVITNGYNVYPRNIEEAIYQHPSVEECIVAGLPDKQRGEIVKAWIKLKDGRELTLQDLKTFLADRLSSMEMPKRFEFRDEPLPKTLIGKLSRKDLVEQELNKKKS